MASPSIPPASAAAAASSSSSSDLPPWSDVPYLLQQYYHDDPKKLNDFRLPELDALCQLFHAPQCYTKSSVLYSSPFLPCRFPSEDHIRSMAARAILVTRWTELWSEGSTIQQCIELFNNNNRGHERVRKFTEDAQLTFSTLR